MTANNDALQTLRGLLSHANDDLRLAQGIAEEVTPRNRIAALDAAIDSLRQEAPHAE